MQSVLIVDDDVAVAQSLAMVLEADGYRSTVVNGAGRARRLLASRRFDCVLTDWRMPGEDGLHLVSDLARQPDAPPAILMSAHIVADTVGAAMAAGCVDVLPKPIDLPRLRQALARAAKPLARRGGTATDLLPCDRPYESWDEDLSLCRALRVDPKAETEPSLAPVSGPPSPSVPSLGPAVLAPPRPRRRRLGRRRQGSWGLLALAALSIVLAFLAVSVLLLQLTAP